MRMRGFAQRHTVEAALAPGAAGTDARRRRQRRRAGARAAGTHQRVHLRGSDRRDDDLDRDRRAVRKVAGGEHALHVAEFGGALAGLLAEGCAEYGVVEEFRQLNGEGLGVAGFEGEAGGAQNFYEGAEIRSDYGEASEHIFGDDQTEDFAAEGGDDYQGNGVEEGVAFGGGQAAAYGTSLDGISANTSRALYTSTVSSNAPSVEAIDQFSIDSAGYKAEFGHAAGNMTFASKSGTNSYHGNVYEFHN